MRIPVVREQFGRLDVAGQGHHLMAFGGVDGAHHDVQDVGGQGATGPVRPVLPDRPGQIEYAGAAAGERLGGVQDPPVLVLAAANQQVPAEVVRVGHAQRGLGSGQLEQDPSQRAVEGVDRGGGPAVGEAESGADVGGYVDGERLTGSRPGADDAGRAGLSGDRGDLGDRPEQLDQAGDVVRADVEQRTGAALKQKGRVGVPGLRSRLLHQGQRGLRLTDVPARHRPADRLRAGAEKGVGGGADPEIRLGGGLQQLGGAVGVERDRLLVVDVLAGRDRRQGDLGMRLRDGQVHHDVDVVALPAPGPPRRPPAPRTQRPGPGPPRGTGRRWPRP